MSQGVKRSFFHIKYLYLQQALGLFADNDSLAGLRKNVEGNFEVLKTPLTPMKEHQEVRLSSQQAQW